MRFSCCWVLLALPKLKAPYVESITPSSMLPGAVASRSQRPLKPQRMAEPGPSMRPLMGPPVQSGELGSRIRLVAGALVSSKPLRQKKTSPNRQRRLITSAEDYVAHLTDQPLRIGKLCRELNTSERTLRNVFHKLAGTSPLAYLKTEQLNRAYRALNDADPTEALIKQVAHRCGFRHIGQFCGDYKKLFGELPSETLQRG